MQKKTSAQAGFSLVELLVAVVILAVGLLGLAELQITATKANAQSDSMTVANGIAQKVIEEVCAMDPDDARFTADAGLPAGEVSQVWTGPEGTETGTYNMPGAGDYLVTYDVDANYETVIGLTKITFHVRSANAVANVTGNKVRNLEVSTFKRSF